MQICFNLPHAFESHSTDLENSYVLRALLDCLVSINLAYLRRHQVSRLYLSGVRYGRTVVWDPIPALYARRFGDCKSLAAALIAEYAVQGIQSRPVFRFDSNNRGGNNFHILVEVPGKNGYDKTQYEDPSKHLGMGQNEARWFGPLF